MQERSRGSKRFEPGDVPTRASIYQEDHTPAHWPPPTDANARRTGVQRKQRTPRNGLIASQLGMPTQSRAPAQAQHYPPDSWQTQAAADGDWPLDSSYDSGAQPAAAYGEYSTYDEDAELQAALDLDNSQGLYDEQFGAYYSSATPALDLRLPPVAADHAQHDYHAYAQAYAEPWSHEDDLVTSHYTRHGQPHAPSGKYPFAQVARQSSQPSAAKWQAQQPIQRAAPAGAGANPYAAPTRANAQVADARAKRASTSQPRTNAQHQPNRNANAQLNRNANAQPNRNAYAQPNRNANAQPNRNANAQPNRNANAQPNRNATMRASSAPMHLNQTANAQFERNANALARTANTQARNAPAHLDQTAGAQFERYAHAHNAPTHLNRSANAPSRLNQAGNLQVNRGGTAQLGRTAARQPIHAAPAPRPAARSFIDLDDEPIAYPKPRRSGWLKTLGFLICIAGGAYAARDQIAPAILTTPAARPQAVPAPAPAPAIAPPAVPTPVPEAAPAPTPTPAPEPTTPQDDARARRSAARAAIIAERWRERRAARRAQNEDDDESDRSVAAASGPTQPAHYAPKPAAEPGILRINSRPWSNVFIDGQPVGHTPQMNLQLPAGQHQITLINNEMQLRKAIHVTITPGETTTQTINLAE